MKKKWMLPVTAVAIAIALVAIWLAVPDASLVGEWQIVGSGYGDGIEASIEFNEDGTFTIVSIGNSKNIPMAQPDQPEVMFETMIVGTWELDEDQLIMIFNDQGMRIDGVRIKRTTIQQGIEKQNILASLNSYSPYVMKWNGADEFTTEAKDQTRRYTRIAEN